MCCMVPALTAIDGQQFAIYSFIHFSVSVPCLSSPLPPIAEQDVSARRLNLFYGLV